MTGPIDRHDGRAVAIRFGEISGVGRRLPIELENAPHESSPFLAVLIYDDGAGRYSEEPHRIQADHPEIAYQIALSRGAEERYGRRFLGLAALEVDQGHDERLAAAMRPRTCARRSNSARSRIRALLA